MKWKWNEHVWKTKRHALDRSFPIERSAERRRFTEQWGTMEEAFKNQGCLRREAPKTRLTEEQAGGDERVQKRFRKNKRKQHREQSSCWKIITTIIHTFLLVSFWMNKGTKWTSTKQNKKYHKQQLFDLSSAWSLSRWDSLVEELPSKRNPGNTRQDSKSGMFAKFH